ncbi:MAG: hypothetical protein JWN10_2763, partial [Solirubrobacterales bacterium]|nr:hypothetical protein [Solirubrobacterales bacterium]
HVVGPNHLAKLSRQGHPEHVVESIRPILRPIH